MESTMRRWIPILLILALSACSTPPTPAPASTASPAPSSIPPLTTDEVMSARLSLSTLTGDVPLTYPLVDGKYEAANGNVSVRLLDVMAFGDLNGDGAGDAAALVAENYGGSGTFVSLVVFLNESGSPAQTAITPIDDRPMIKAVNITAGQIALEATIHGFEDPMCCPTLETTRHYALNGSSLTLRDFSTLAADGRWREITITTPLDGESPSSVQVAGTVAVSPFENNLSYHLYDSAGMELAAGPIPVTAAGLGTPGAFDTLITLNGVATGATVRLEIQDLSAADGSLLAMDSVMLTIK
jgi:hypothetical protein